jgi:hypothetical protein
MCRLAAAKSYLSLAGALKCIVSEDEANWAAASDLFYMFFFSFFAVFPVLIFTGLVFAIF